MRISCLAKDVLFGPYIEREALGRLIRTKLDVFCDTKYCT